MNGSCWVSGCPWRLGPGGGSQLDFLAGEEGEELPCQLSLWGFVGKTVHEWVQREQVDLWQPGGGVGSRVQEEVRLQSGTCGLPKWTGSKRGGRGQDTGKDTKGLGGVRSLPLVFSTPTQSRSAAPTFPR